MSDFGNLPIEIVHNILARLPITSLGKCRCVCKSWSHLIADPFFINKQVYTNRHGRSIDGNRTHYFFLDYDYKGYSPSRSDNCPALNYDYTYISSYSLRSSDTFGLRKQVKNPAQDYFTVRSSCNGVLCLDTKYISKFEYAVFLWNPSINKYKILPNPDQFPTSCDVEIFLGIGFDAGSNDYKVVCLNMARINSRVFSPQIEIYSLSTNSWRKLRTGCDVQWRLYGDNTDTSINGVVHWTARKTSSDIYDSRFIIVSFDFADEVLKEISLPKYSCTKPRRKPGVVSVIYGKLAFSIDYLCVTSDELVWEIWLLEDYNDTESWTKYHSITSKYGRPLQFLDNGDYVMKDFRKKRLIIFNPKTRKIVAKVHGSFFVVVNYTESLVLLNEGLDALSAVKSKFAKVEKKKEKRRKKKRKRKRRKEEEKEELGIARRVRNCIQRCVAVAKAEFIEMKPIFLVLLVLNILWWLLILFLYLLCRTLGFS